VQPPGEAIVLAPPPDPSGMVQHNDDDAAPEEVNGPLIPSLGIPSLVFITYFIIIQSLTTSDETSLPIRRVEVADAVEGYRHFIDMSVLFSMFSLKKEFAEFFRAFKYKAVGFFPSVARFRITPNHLVTSAKSQRFAQSVTASVGGVASGTVLFAFAFICYSNSRPKWKDYELSRHVICSFLRVIPPTAPAFLSVYFLLDSTRLKMSIRGGRVVGFITILTQWKMLGLWSKTGLLCGFQNIGEDCLLQDVLLFIYFLPSSVDDNIMKSCMFLFNNVCFKIEANLLITGLLTRKLITERDAQASGYRMSPQCQADVWRRYMGHNAGTIHSVIPHDQVEAGARGSRFAELFAARHMAVILALLAPLMEAYLSRVDLLIFDESRVGKQQLLLIHCMICGFLLPCPVQILDSAPVSEAQTRRTLDDISVQASAALAASARSRPNSVDAARTTPSGLLRRHRKNMPTGTATKEVLKGIANGIAFLVKAGFAAYARALIGFVVCCFLFVFTAMLLLLMVFCVCCFCLVSYYFASHNTVSFPLHVCVCIYAFA